MFHCIIHMQKKKKNCIRKMKDYKKFKYQMKKNTSISVWIRKCGIFLITPFNREMGDIPFAPKRWVKFLHINKSTAIFFSCFCLNTVRQHYFLLFCAAYLLSYRCSKNFAIQFLHHCCYCYLFYPLSHIKQKHSFILSRFSRFSSWHKLQL